MCPVPPEIRSDARRPGLCLTIKEGEEIRIGDVVVTFEEQLRRSIRLRIHAPREVEIRRQPREVE